METVYITLALIFCVALGYYLCLRFSGSKASGLPSVDWSAFGREVGLYIIGLFVLTTFTFTLWETLHVEIPQANRDVVMILIGVISTKTSTIIDWFFGSSKGSADKTKALTDASAIATAGAALPLVDGDVPKQRT